MRHISKYTFATSDGWGPIYQISWQQVPSRHQVSKFGFCCFCHFCVDMSDKGAYCCVLLYGFFFQFMLVYIRNKP